jgi:hypothetical protein
MSLRGEVRRVRSCPLLSPKGGSKRIGQRDIKISTDLDFSLSAFSFLPES